MSDSSSSGSQIFLLILATFIVYCVYCARRNHHIKKYGQMYSGRIVSTRGEVGGEAGRMVVDIEITVDGSKVIARSLQRPKRIGPSAFRVITVIYSPRYPRHVSVPEWDVSL